jgi:hypothetical protein
MAIQFKDGAILFVTGAIAMHADCCCESTTCCPEANGATLTLTVSDLTLDGGETCHADCLVGITGNSLGTWNESTLTWLVDEGNPGEAILAALTCTGSQIYFSTDTILVHDADGDVLCEIATEPDTQALTGITCDPLYWEGDITVTVADENGDPCGTGTIHVIISE